MEKSQLKATILSTMDSRDVAFIDDPNQDPRLSRMERLRPWITPSNVVGNADYLARLMLTGRNGVHSPAPPRNGHNASHIVVPGYASANRVFRPLASMVPGMSTSTNYEEPRFRSPLPADDAAEELRREIKSRDDEVINLVCHSRGGILAVLACDSLDDDTRARIGRIVTLGTPWQGAPVAHLVGLVRQDSALRELSPGSDFLTRRLAAVSDDTRGRVISVSSTDDKIAPWRNCILDRAALNVLLRGQQAVTHAGLLSSPKLAAMISAVLNGKH